MDKNLKVFIFVTICVAQTLASLNIVQDAKNIIQNHGHKITNTKVDISQKLSAVSFELNNILNPAIIAETNQKISDIIQDTNLDEIQECISTKNNELNNFKDQIGTALNPCKTEHDSKQNAIRETSTKFSTDGFKLLQNVPETVNNCETQYEVTLIQLAKCLNKELTSFTSKVNELINNFVNAINSDTVSLKNSVSFCVADAIDIVTIPNKIVNDFRDCFIPNQKQAVQNNLQTKINKVEIAKNKIPEIVQDLNKFIADIEVNLKPKITDVIKAYPEFDDIRLDPKIDECISNEVTRLTNSIVEDCRGSIDNAILSLKAEDISNAITTAREDLSKCEENEDDAIKQIRCQQNVVKMFNTDADIHIGKINEIEEKKSSLNEELLNCANNEHEILDLEKVETISQVKQCVIIQ